MRHTLSRRQSQDLDRRAVKQYGIPSIVLMENAGRGVADTLQSLGIDGDTVICCGKGNNGGDGLVLARHLALRGYGVSLLLWAAADDLRGDAAINFHIARRCKIRMYHVGNTEGHVDRLRQADWIIDALLGTGARGEPRPPLDAAIGQINSSRRRVLAVDCPSGLDCDTGRPAGQTVRAAHTCTFVAAKPGFSIPGAGQYTGEIHICDIGTPQRLLDEVLAESVEGAGKNPPQTGAL